MGVDRHNATTTTFDCGNGNDDGDDNDNASDDGDSNRETVEDETQGHVHRTVTRMEQEQRTLLVFRILYVIK